MNLPAILHTATDAELLAVRAAEASLKAATEAYDAAEAEERRAEAAFYAARAARAAAAQMRADARSALSDARYIAGLSLPETVATARRIAADYPPAVPVASENGCHIAILYGDHPTRRRIGPVDGHLWPGDARATRKAGAWTRNGETWTEIPPDMPITITEKP